jgi:hypothetical protein
VGSYPRYSQLRTMSDEGLIAELDRIAERSELDALCYLEELTLRELARQTRILLWLGWIMAVLTFAVAMLAVAVALNS